MNVLAIGAHFDDIELGCSGSLIKHRKNGNKVYMLVVTHSGYSDYHGNGIRNKDLARKEGEEAAKIIGSKLICLEYETKQVSYDYLLIEDINKVIDEYKIDIIYTHWTGDIHQDHSAIARATLSAARHVKKILMYRSNWYASDLIFSGRYYIDISMEMEEKIKSIKAHKSACTIFGKKWIDFMVQQDHNSGIEMETEYAEVFEVIKYLA